MFQRTSRRTGGATTPASGSVTNSQLADMAEGTVKLRALGTGTGAPIDGTGLQLGQLARRESFVVDSTSSGTVTTYTIATTTTQVNFKLAGDITIHGMDANIGQTIEFSFDQASAGSVTWINDSASAATSLNRVRVGGRNSLTIRNGDCVVMTYFDSRWRVVGSGASLKPALLAPVQSNLAIPFLVYVSCASGGAAGTADDVTIWNAAAPFAMRIIDAQLRVSTAVGGSSAALRTASGGGGSVVLPDPAVATQTFSTAATGVLEDLATATATVALNGSLFLRRSDRSVVGELMLTCIRT